MSENQQSDMGENGVEEGGTGTALVLYMGEALEQTQAWTRLPEDERKRQAMDAAQRHDVAALWRLTENWLLTHGEQVAHVSPHTRAAYARGGHLLLEPWRHENLLRASRMADADWRTHLEDCGLRTSCVRVYLATARALYAALRAGGATTADSSFSNGGLATPEGTVGLRRAGILAGSNGGGREVDHHGRILGDDAGSSHAGPECIHQRPHPLPNACHLGTMVERVHSVLLRLTGGLRDPMRVLIRPAPTGDAHACCPMRREACVERAVEACYLRGDSGRLL